LLEAAAKLGIQLWKPGRDFRVGICSVTNAIILYGYWDDLEALNAPDEFEGFSVGFGPLDEAMGT